MNNLWVNKIYGLRVWAKLNWFNNGDKGFELFFTYIKDKDIEEKIDKIWYEDKFLNKQVDIKRYFFLYYKNLIISKGDNAANHNARANLKQIILKKIYEEKASI